MRAWLGVVSRAHVQRGLAGGFAQVCHGKAGPLRRMQRGDWLVYYSPTETMGGTPLRVFTAIGEVEDDEVFQFDMGGGFVPYRRRIRYAPASEVALRTIQSRLELCASANWGMALRRGHLPLSEEDFGLIATSMGAHPPRASRAA